MGRFFFDIDNGATSYDRTGLELDCDDAVRSEAMLIAVQQVWANASSSDGTSLVVIVRDEANTTRLKVQLALQLSVS